MVSRPVFCSSHCSTVAIREKPVQTIKYPARNTAVGTYGALRSRRRRLMVAKAATIGLAPGTIIAAIMADHITNIRRASIGVHDGSMPFMDMSMSRHMAASISSIRID